MARGSGAPPLEAGDYRTVLDLSGFPAYVLGPGAELVYANAAALGAAGAVSDAKRAQLAELVRPGGCPPEFRVVPIAIDGRRHHLIYELLAELDLDAGPRAMGAVYGLSGRETDVLVLLSQGRTQREMARELDIEASTVATHVDGIRDKLDARTKGLIFSLLRAFELAFHRRPR